MSDPRGTDDGAPSPEERVEREAWLQELGEASVLPSEDETRRAVEAKVKARGGWAQAHWEALLRERDVWHRALADVEPPEELPARLRRIPAQHPLVSLRRRRLIWGAAAVMLLGLGGAWLLAAGRGDESREPSRSVAQVALLALNDHLDTHEQDVLRDEPAALARDLQDHIPFPVDLPDLGADVRPVGGRRCTLGSHVVAFTAWRGKAGRLTLLQLRRGDFGLPADMAPRVVHPEGQAAQRRPLDVFFFGRGDTVWVVVADDAEDLRRVREFVTRT